jgi:hypothetical protein
MEEKNRCGRVYVQQNKDTKLKNNKKIREEGNFVKVFFFFFCIPLYTYMYYVSYDKLIYKP